MKTLLKILLAAALPAAGLLYLAVTKAAPEADPDAPVTLRSDRVVVEVAPALGGRIMSYMPAGCTNLLWVAPQDAPLFWGWKNHGGEKVWIGPQENWLEHFGAGWPPPASFDQDKYRKLSATDTATTLMSAPINIAGTELKILRSVRILDQADVMVSSRKILTNAIGEDGDFAELPDTATLWTIAQIPVPDTLYVRLFGQKRFHNTGIDNNKPLPAPHPAGDLLRFDLADLPQSGKATMDADLFAVPVDNGLFVYRLANSKKHINGDRTDTAQLYVAAAKDLPAGTHAPYAELEFALPGLFLDVTLSYIPLRKDDNVEAVITAL